MILRSIQEVVDVIGASRGGSTRTIVGIAGAPGAGKSTLAARVVAAVPNSVLLPMDGYHLTQAELVKLGRRDRMGAPDTFDVDALLQTIADLRISGGTVFAPGFDREREEPVPDAIAIQPELRTVVIEGNYLLLNEDRWAEVGEALDLALYLELDDEVRWTRLIERHVHYGKTVEAARAWALGTDEDNARLIQTTAGRADHQIRLP